MCAGSPTHLVAARGKGGAFTSSMVALQSVVRKCPRHF